MGDREPCVHDWKVSGYHDDEVSSYHCGSCNTVYDVPEDGTEPPSVGTRHMVTRAQQPKEKRLSTAIRLPESLVARLDEECNKRVVGRNFLITRAIEHYLDRLPPVEP